MPKKKKRSTKMAEKLRKRNRQLSSRLRGWKPGDRIPRNLTTKEQKYIGERRHEAALKEYKKKKKRKK